ncbi:MAG: energy-coupled thiamine transporter ThiT [Defluviitaleaceae bacterium]|nr:energy-coupled thiamine transporter ThiT [Defluviitaleaceae bacterium]
MSDFSNGGAAHGTAMARTKMLVVCAVCIAMAFVLNQISLFRMPQGGSVTPFSMLFVVLAGYWLGPVWGIITGVSMGLLNAMTGSTVHPINPVVGFVLDYPVAFGLLGISGFFRKMKFGLQIGYVAGVFGRFVSVFMSGFIIWGGVLSSADVITGEFLMAAAGFSAVYNATYIVPEMIATLVVISLPAMRHAVDEVTKIVLPPAEYAWLVAKNKGSISINARIVTGAVVGAVGGLGFVLAAYIRRLEEIAIIQYTTNHELLTEMPRIIRTIERNTQQILALQAVGVIFIALGAALLISVLAPKNET